MVGECYNGSAKNNISNPLYPIVKMILHYPCEVTVLNSVDSTNNYIKTLELGDVPWAVIALEQTAGRGTHGRSFWSPGGTGVYLTIGFKPESVPIPLDMEQIQTVTRMAGVAVRRVLSRYSLDEPRIKPVNDILIDGRKVAGILTEGLTEGVGKFSAIYVGIGVNCFEAALPEDIRETATWNNHPAREFTVLELAQDIIDEFLGLLKGLDVEKVLEEYEDWKI